MLVTFGTVVLSTTSLNAPGGVMLSSKEYISLESACSAIKASSPAVLQELSRQVLGILDPESQFNPVTICVFESGKPSPGIAITYQDIGNYLLAATGRHTPVLLHAESGTVESSRVMVSRNWINRQLKTVQESLSIGVAIEEPAANQQLSIVQSVNSKPSPAWVDQPPPINSEGYKKLRKWLVHQNDQRKANESASKLAIQLEEAVARAERSETIVAARDAEIEHLLTRDRLQTMELSSKERVIQSQKIKISELEERNQDLPRQSPESNISRRNSGIRAAKEAAQNLAQDLWITAEFRGIRVGEMGIEVWSRMSIGEHAQRMPMHAATVTKWLKEADVPANANLPGRPKKKK